MMTLTLILVGLAGLVIGGELLVRGAVSAARSFGIPPMVIGLTLVGFGTSMPELVTSLHAALTGSSGIAVGNVVGSNIGNVLLILGIAALIAPVAVNPAAFRRDGTVMMGATLLCVGAVLVGEVGRLGGLLLIGALVAYLTWTLVTERRAQRSAAVAMYEAESEAVRGPDDGLGVSLVMAAVGLVITILGARFLVTGGVAAAQAVGLSEAVIGLTIVAIGTSMPELVTAIIAVRKGEGDVALGNVIGSNIFNILGILGMTALVQPLQVPAEIIRFDIWVMAAAALLLVLFARSGWRVTRREGGLMLTLYLAYLGWLLI